MYAPEGGFSAELDRGAKRLRQAGFRIVHHVLLNTLLMDTTFYFHYNPLTPTHTLSVLLAYYFLAIYLLLYMHMHMHMHMCMQMYMCILSLQGGFSSPVEAALERARWAKSLEKTRELRGPRGGRKQQNNGVCRGCKQRMQLDCA